MTMSETDHCMGEIEVPRVSSSPVGGHSVWDRCLTSQITHYGGNPVPLDDRCEIVQPRLGWTHGILRPSLMAMT